MQTDAEFFGIVGMVVSLVVLLWMGLQGDRSIGQDESLDGERDKKKGLEDFAIHTSARATGEELWESTDFLSVHAGDEKVRKVGGQSIPEEVFSGRGQREGAICWISGVSREDCDCPSCEKRRRRETK